jgi:hypothetical protein
MSGRGFFVTAWEHAGDFGIEGLVAFHGGVDETVRVLAKRLDALRSGGAAEGADRSNPWVLAISPTTE